MRKFWLSLFLLAPLAANAQSVQQSGNVTPGHAACWAITGVVYDCGLPAGSSIVGSYTANDLVAVNGSGSLIDSGISAVNTSNITSQWNFNGGVTVPTASVGTNSTQAASTAFVQQNNSSGVNVLAYGADPSGAVDSVPAVVNAMGGGNQSVYFPPGTYKFNECLVIPSGTKLFSAPGLAIIHVPTTINLTGCANGWAIYNTGYATADTNIIIDGLTFQGDGISQTQVTKVVFANVSGLRIENARFTNFGNPTYYNQGLIAVNITNSFINNNKFDSNSGDGFALGQGTGNNHNIIVANLFSGNGDYGFACVNCNDSAIVGNTSTGNTNAGIGVDQSNNVAMTGNSTSANGSGLVVFKVIGQSTYITISGSTSDADGIGIYDWDCSYCSISGNTVKIPNSMASPYGIWVQGSDHGDIGNNTITVSSGGSNVGIYVQSVAGKTTQYIHVHDNTITGGQDGILEQNSGGTLGVNWYGFNAIIGASTPISVSAGSFHYADTTVSGVALSAVTLALAGNATLTVPSAGSSFLGYTATNGVQLLQVLLTEASYTLGVVGGNVGWLTGSQDIYIGPYSGSSVIFVSGASPAIWMDYNHTNAGQVTIKTAVNVSGALAATLTIGNGTNPVCYNTGNGLFTYATTACTASAVRFKDLGAPEPLNVEGLAGLTTGVSWSYKKDSPFYQGGRIHVGLFADDVERLDPRCVSYDEGGIENYDRDCVLAYLVEAFKQLSDRVTK